MKNEPIHTGSLDEIVRHVEKARKAITRIEREESLDCILVCLNEFASVNNLRSKVTTK
jgi:hypothetical protein